MTGKIRELAEKWAIFIYPGLNERFTEWREVRNGAERILRAELKPLLDAAKEAADCPLAGELDRLAAELQHWRKP